MSSARPPVPRFYRFAATGLGAAMWFWVCCPSIRIDQAGGAASELTESAKYQIFYRAKKDAPVLLGWKHPWDH
ncbi:hypothetical protein VTK56DRAFT_7379 [Thermocarpiscus australiensis]